MSIWTYHAFEFCPSKVRFPQILRKSMWKSGRTCLQSCYNHVFKALCTRQRRSRKSFQENNWLIDDVKQCSGLRQLLPADHPHDNKFQVKEQSWSWWARADHKKGAKRSHWILTYRITHLQRSRVVHSLDTSLGDKNRKTKLKLLVCAIHYHMNSWCCNLVMIAIYMDDDRSCVKQRANVFLNFGAKGFSRDLPDPES